MNLCVATKEDMARLRGVESPTSGSGDQRGLEPFRHANLR